ncbi:hypothetical protein HanPI659440_Chr06g0235241 [Helianthus annuus]|nr:hypothetical protein HanPI659440_Chr06g0235241 [Helianthus annuus]
MRYPKGFWQVYNHYIQFVTIWLVIYIYIVLYKYLIKQYICTRCYKNLNFTFVHNSLVERSQIFQAFPPLQILPLHCFNPISFDLILFPKPTSPVQIWKIPEDLRLEDTPNPNSNRDVICAYKVFTEVDSRPCSSEIGTIHP